MDNFFQVSFNTCLSTILGCFGKVFTCMPGHATMFSSQLWSRNFASSTIQNKYSEDLKNNILAKLTFVFCVQLHREIHRARRVHCRYQVLVNACYLAILSRHNPNLIPSPDLFSTRGGRVGLEMTGSFTDMVEAI